MEVKDKLLNKSIIDNLLKNRLSKEKITPIVKLVKREKSYNVYIFLRGLVKKEIKIKYISNFLIINMNLKNKYTSFQEEFKRSFYLNNLDIDNIKIATSTNIISLKIPYK
ncbi:Hsp20/alpha crystallin family protein [Clostridium sp.]|uniref:Hsp20/alpha crystallin family protein n=1 Tax=Clostridium sp. TaxID=1506 RepID=UPI00262B8127|nr:Hsp20/alpha crystallin family protein [Clostridium sp.]